MNFDWHMLYPLPTAILDNSRDFRGVPCRAQLCNFSKCFFRPRFGVVPIWELWQFWYVRKGPPKNICRIDNFNLLPVAQSPIAHTTRGSSSSWCPAKRMYNPPPPSMTTASGSTKSSRMMVCMWCRRSTRAFPLMAVYGLSCGMLPTSAAAAFSVVCVTNGKGVAAGTHAGTPCWNPFLR